MCFVYHKIQAKQPKKHKLKIKSIAEDFQTVFIALPK